MLEPTYYRGNIFLYSFITRYLLYVHEIYQMAWPITSDFHHNERETNRHTDSH